MTTEERLEKVEHELTTAKYRNRRLLALLVLAVVAFVLAGTLTQTTDTALGQADEKFGKIIRANAFVLEDYQGQPRAQMLMTVQGPSLALYDEKGELRVGLGVGKDGPQLALLDETGQLRAGLSVTVLGSGLTLLDETGQLRAALSVNVLGSGLHLYDEYGRMVWSPWK